MEYGDEIYIMLIFSVSGVRSSLHNRKFEFRLLSEDKQIFVVYDRLHDYALKISAFDI